MSNILGGLLPGDFLANELLSEVSLVMHPLKAKAAALKPVIFIKPRRSIDFSGIVTTFQIFLSGIFIQNFSMGFTIISKTSLNCSNLQVFSHILQQTSSKT